MNLESDDRKRLDYQRSQAARYFVENYTREQRYLIIFERDFSEYLKSAAWLRTAEARNCQKYYDFLCDFERLKELMKEFRWSKEFLLENGIDFVSIKKLYFSVA
jgi:hypothetical protein